MVAGHQSQVLKQALVVGGQANFVMDKLSKSLKRHGIGVHTHLSWKKRRPPAALPKGIDLVYICTDMVGHGLSAPCMNYARELGIPYVNGTRKWAESIERLTAAGFPLIDPKEVLPEIIEEVIASRPPGTPPTDADLRGIAIALVGDVARAEQYFEPAYNDKTGHVHLKGPAPLEPTSTVVTAALPELSPAPAKTPEPTKEPTMPLNNPPESRIVSLGITNEKQKAYLGVLIAEPVIMNKDIWDRLKDLPLFRGNKLDPQRASYAREQLGIKVTRADSKRYIDIDLEKFMETAEALKVKYNLPEARYSFIEGAPEAPAPVPGPMPDKVFRDMTPAVVDLASATVLELLAALRAAMKTENYTEIHVTPDGIGYKKIVVSEGKFDI